MRHVLLWKSGSSRETGIGQHSMFSTPSVSHSDSPHFMSTIFISPATTRKTCSCVHHLSHRVRREWLFIKKCEMIFCTKKKSRTLISTFDTQMNSASLHKQNSNPAVQTRHLGRMSGKSFCGERNMLKQRFLSNKEGVRSCIECHIGFHNCCAAIPLPSGERKLKNLGLGARKCPTGVQCGQNMTFQKFENHGSLAPQFCTRWIDSPG